MAYEMKILSAYRLPDMTADYARSARERGLQVIICGAGMAAHLAGAVAAQTTLMVIGVPLASGPPSGVDALYATVQMTSGIPVATAAVDGMANAAYLACQILALKDKDLTRQLEDMRQVNRDKILTASSRLKKQTFWIRRNSMAFSSLYIRPNPAGDRPAIQPSAFIDPSAQIIGNVRIKEQNYQKDVLKACHNIRQAYKALDITQEQ